MRMFQQEEFATALKKEWRSRLTLMQPTVTNTGGLARRPKNLGGAAPWLVAVLRGAAWGEESAETLLNEMAEEVDARLEEDAIAAADAVAGRRSVAQHPCRYPPRRRLKLTGVLVVQRGKADDCRGGHGDAGGGLGGRGGYRSRGRGAEKPLHPERDVRPEVMAVTSAPSLASNFFSGTG